MEVECSSLTEVEQALQLLRQPGCCVTRIMLDNMAKYDAALPGSPPAFNLAALPRCASCYTSTRVVGTCILNIDCLRVNCIPQLRQPLVRSSEVIDLGAGCTALQKLSVASMHPTLCLPRIRMQARVCAHTCTSAQLCQRGEMVYQVGDI